MVRSTTFLFALWRWERADRLLVRVVRGIGFLFALWRWERADTVAEIETLTAGMFLFALWRWERADPSHKLAPLTRADAGLKHARLETAAARSDEGCG